MAARKKRDRHRRRRGRFGFLYKLLSFLVIFAAILIGCVAFFRVNQVTVSGNSRYTAEEIVAASGVELGDNLFLISKPQTAQSIIKRLPYVENVSPILRLPDTLELRVTETAAVAAVQAEGQWWLLDARGKVLEVGETAMAQGLPQVNGLTPIAPALGVRMAVEAQEQTKLESLRGLLTALAGQGLTGGLTEFIDLTQAGTIHFGYNGLLTVAVPMTGDFAETAFRLQRTLEYFQQQGEVVTGTLDLTYTGKRARLLTSRWMPETYTPVQEGGGQDGQAQQPQPAVPTGGADDPDAVTPEPPSVAE